MKLQLLLLALASLPFLVFAQETKKEFGSITGTVISADDKPCQYVSVVIVNTKDGTITDELGNFKLKKIRTGNHLINISLLGHIDTVISVDVSANKNVFIKIQLLKAYAELSEVIVRANTNKYVETHTSGSLRFNLPLLEVPQNIAVVTNQLINDQGLVGTLEATRNVSGIQKTYGTVNDYTLNIRGIDATWNVFRNGVGGGAYWWNQPEDAAMIEKIEYIKGPAGFMISMAEAGGMLNIVTKQPVKEKIAELNLGYGSYNLMRLSADFGGVLNKSGKLSYRFNAGVHRQQRDFQFGKASRYFICPVLKYDFSPKTSVTVEYNYMRGKTKGNNDDLPSIDGKMFSLPRNFAAADPATDDLTVYDNYLRVQANHQFNKNWNLYIQAAYVHGLWKGYLLTTDPDMPVSNDTLYRVSRFHDFRNYSYSFQAFTEKKILTGKKINHQFLTGIDICKAGFDDVRGGTWGEQKFGLYLPDPVYYADRDSLRNFPIDDTSFFKVHWIGLYMQDHIKIASKFVITLAGRFTHSSIDATWIPEEQKPNTYDVFTPRVGFTWLFSDDLSAYSLYEKSFWPQFGRTFDNTEIKPLTGSNKEVGVKSYFFKKRFSLNASLFHLVKNNLLTNDPQHIGYMIQRGQVASKGFELDATGNIINAIVLNVNYGLTDAKITKETDSLMIGVKNWATPNHAAKLWINYKLLKSKLKGLSFGLGYQFTGKRSAVWYYNPDPATRFLPVYHLLNASVNYTKDKFNLNLSIYNITNSRYADVGHYNMRINEWRYTPGEPINFRLSFAVKLLTKKGISK